MKPLALLVMLAATPVMAQEMAEALRAQPDLFFSLLRDRMMGPR